MRKILFLILIILLCLVMYLVIWNDIPNLGFIHTYAEVKDAYTKYQNKVQELERKNNEELPGIMKKLKFEYSENDKEDNDNIIKKYNKSKKEYEEILALEMANSDMDNSELYNIELVWQKVSEYANNNNLDVKMNIEKSNLDINSKDFDICNLDFEIVGTYQYLIEFLQSIETDPTIRLKISDFDVENFNKTSNIQGKEFDKETDNMIITNQEENNEEHKLDLKAKFKVYNIPVNKSTITSENSEDTSEDSKETEENTNSNEIE